MKSTGRALGVTALGVALALGACKGESDKPRQVKVASQDKGDVKKPAQPSKEPAATPKTPAPTSGKVSGFCTDTGWCYARNPGLASLDIFRGVTTQWGADGLAYASTGEGRLWSYNGDRWSDNGRALGDVVTRLGGASGKVPVGLSNKAAVMTRQDDGTWLRAGIFEGGKGRVMDAWINDPKNLWAWIVISSGATGSTLARWDGQNFHRVALPEVPERSVVSAVAPLEGGEAWVAIGVFDEGGQYTHKLYERKRKGEDAFEWRATQHASSDGLALWTSPEGRVFMGKGDTIFEAKDGQWAESRKLGRTGHFVWVRGFGTRALAFFQDRGAKTGRMLRYDGQKWADMGQKLGQVAPHRTVMLSDKEAVAGWLNKALTVWDGEAWSAPETLRAIWGSKDGGELLAVGDQGRIMRRSEGLWRTEARGARTLYDVWSDGAGLAVAVGDKGAVWMRGQDGKWSAQEALTDKTLTTVWGKGPQEVYASGPGAPMLRYDGKAWSVASPDGADTIRGAAGQLFMTRGGVLYDGAGKALGDTGEEAVSALWARSDKEVYVAAGKQLFLYDGQQLGLDGDLTRAVLRRESLDLSGLGGDDHGTYAVSKQGMLFVRRSPGRWKRTSTGTRAGLFGVWGSGDTTWIVGQHGLILGKTQEEKKNP